MSSSRDLVPGDIITFRPGCPGRLRMRSASGLFEVNLDGGQLGLVVGLTMWHVANEFVQNEVHVMVPSGRIGRLIDTVVLSRGDLVIIRGRP